MINIEEIAGEVSKETKLGSTRTVYFPLNKKTIILDGIETKVQTVIKVAHSHQTAEQYIEKCTLGKMQNNNEIELSKSKYSIYTKNVDGTYSTNHNGILPTIINFDINNNWVEMLRVQTPLTSHMFNKLSFTEKFPKGIFFDEMRAYVFKHYHDTFYSGKNISKEFTFYDIGKHSFVKTYNSYMVEFKVIPEELKLKNSGYIVHPLTAKKSIVICDYGFTGEYCKFFSSLLKDIYDKESA